MSSRYVGTGLIAWASLIVVNQQQPSSEPKGPIESSMLVCAYQLTTVTPIAVSIWFNWHISVTKPSPEKVC
ncbi:MAG: hypothetical protein VYA34_12590 [Myxococcota bacterium]|nr:hypothetical protein [Myxococcota bacterium]